MRCRAETKNGNQCKNLALNSKSFCHVHKNHIDFAAVVRTITGAALGNIIVPGFGGIIAGGALGNIYDQHYKETSIMKKKVFVSFDFDNDKKLKDFIIGQSRLPDSPFEIADHSLKEAAPEQNWEAKANAAIKRSDIVVVMVGPQTHRAHGVLKEVKMAQNASKYIVQVIGYKDGDYTAVAGAGRLYRWNWDNLKKLLG